MTETSTHPAPVFTVLNSQPAGLIFLCFRAATYVWATLTDAHLCMLLLVRVTSDLCNTCSTREPLSMPKIAMETHPYATPSASGKAASSADVFVFNLLIKVMKLQMYKPPLLAISNNCHSSQTSKCFPENMLLIAAIAEISLNELLRSREFGSA